MDTKEIKLMIIENFIDHYTSDPLERGHMMIVAQGYVDEDHVDEIAQAMPERKTRYFLFGNYVIRMYGKVNLRVLKGLLDTEGGCIHSISPDDDVSEVLAEYDGWDGYAEITEDEYNKLSGNTDGLTVAIITSSHGEFEIDKSGLVLKRNLDDCEECPEYLTISKFDMDEWKRYWNLPAQDSYDILDLGYWYGDNKYEEPHIDWRL